MSKGETARTNYVSVRDEIMERIQLRDNVLVMYLGAIGAIFGLVLNNQALALEALLVIPYLALGATAIISQHHAMIGSLGLFLATELEPFLKDIGEYAPQWDTSKTIQTKSHRFSWLGRRVGHIIIIDIPAIIALALNWRHSIYLPLGDLLLWWSGVVLTTLSILTLFATSKWRKQLYRQLNVELEKNDSKKHGRKGVTGK